MNKEDWQWAEEQLKVLGNIVKLRIDGYEISLILVRTDIYHNAIMTYINGKFEGKWIIEDCEESRRFYNKTEKRLYTAAKLKDCPKAIKKELEKKTYTTYSCYWTSFNKLKKHFIDNNKNIELIREG